MNNYKLHYHVTIAAAVCTRFDGILARFNNTQKKFRRCRAGYVLRIFEHPFRLECGVTTLGARSKVLSELDPCVDGHPPTRVIIPQCIIEIVFEISEMP